MLVIGCLAAALPPAGATAGTGWVTKPGCDGRAINMKAVVWKASDLNEAVARGYSYVPNPACYAYFQITVLLKKNGTGVNHNYCDLSNSLRTTATDPNQCTTRVDDPLGPQEWTAHVKVTWRKVGATGNNVTTYINTPVDIF